MKHPSQIEASNYTIIENFTISNKILTMLVRNCGAPDMPVVGWDMLYENKEFPGTGGWSGPAGICEFDFMAYTHPKKTH